MIVCDTQTKVLKVPGHLFLEMAQKTGLAKALSKIHKYRASVASLSLARDLSPELINEISLIAKETTFKAGSVIIKEGDKKSNKVFVVLRGSACVTIGGVKKATLYEKQVFGEIGFLHGVARTATVTAATEVKVMYLTKKQFAKIVKKVPMLYFYFGALAREHKEAT